MENKVNIDICMQCKYLHSGPAPKFAGLRLICSVEFNFIDEATIATKFDSKFDMEYNPNFKIPAKCPYILEHAVSS